METVLPFKLSPAYKSYIWGGHKLCTLYHKVAPVEPLAETWELSCHPNGESYIQGGEYDGQTLAAYLKMHPQDLGTQAGKFSGFPVLIKFIDAKENLSVQVHPDDVYALEHEHHLGKMEMWYVISCERDSFLYYGLKQTLSPQEFSQRVKDQTLTDVLNKVMVRPGDVFFIPPGTLHAIGAGCVIAEIQQNSDVTYRVYDYGRIGADGNPRELHLEKAADTARLTAEIPVPIQSPKLYKDGYAVQRLVSCAYFTVDKLDIETDGVFDANKESFHSLLCIEGEYSLYTNTGCLHIQAGESVFIPAGTGRYRISGSSRILRTLIL